MLALQEQRQREVQAQTADDTLFLLEHHPVITLGRNSNREHLLVTPAQLHQGGIDLHDTGRGGDITFHGPGQLVAYFVLALRSYEQDLRAYVYRLEEIILRTAADFGIVAERVPGLRGIWHGNDKLAAIGVRIARWTTLHGLAINVHGVGHGFTMMVPCGLHGRGVTSMADITQAATEATKATAARAPLAAPPRREEVEARLVLHAAAVLQRDVIWAEATPLPSVEPEDRSITPGVPPLPGPGPAAVAAPAGQIP